MTKKDLSLNTFFTSPTCLSLLTAEFGSAAAARAALNDLQQSASLAADAWMSAARVATGNEPAPERWLFILPESHSLVGIYPLALAAVLDLDVTVRLPDRFVADSFIATFITWLKQTSAARVTVADSSLRIRDSNHGFDAILAYGDDSTIASIAAVAGCPVQGFGGRWSASIVDGDNFAAVAPLLAKDALSLAQRGCMSSRLALVAIDDGHDTDALSAHAALAAKEFWSAELPAADRVALDAAVWRYRRLAFATKLPTDARTPLVVTRHLHARDLTAEFMASVATQHPFVIPLLFVNGGNTEFFVKTFIESQLLKQTRATLTLSERFQTLFSRGFLTSSHYEPLSFRALGAANQPIWDGRHELRALFRIGAH